MNAATTLPSDARPERETLAGALQRARAGLAREQPPKAVRAALFASFELQHPPRAPRRRWLGVVFGLLALSLLLMLVLPGPADDGVELHAASGFMPLAPAERWPQVARDARGAGPAWLVATELPRERLAALGLPYDPARAGERVPAELLLHPVTGEVLAVRLLR